MVHAPIFAVSTAYFPENLVRPDRSRQPALPALAIEADTGQTRIFTQSIRGQSGCWQVAVRCHHDVVPRRKTVPKTRVASVNADHEGRAEPQGSQ